jgi:hypothetical protein
MRLLPAFAVCTTLHFILSFASLFIGGGMAMASVDGEGSLLLTAVAFLTMFILLFPVVGLSVVIPWLRGVGTAGEYGLFIVNSMIWGMAGAIVWSRWRTRRRRWL